MGFPLLTESIIKKHQITSHRPILLFNICVVPSIDARVHAHNRVMGVSLLQVGDPLEWGRSTSQETKLGG